MENQWKPFDNETLPPAQQDVLIYVPDSGSQIQIAHWPGQGKRFLVYDNRPGESFLNGTVTHWMPLPEKPED